MSDEEEGGHDEEPWLVSYADMMTLLFGFFVLMYAFAMAKLEKVPEMRDDMVHLRKELTKYFGGEYVTPLQEAADEFKRQLAKTEALNGLEIKSDPEGLDILIRSHGVFDSGSAALKPPVRTALAALATNIQQQGRPYDVVVEGHTDDVPIGKSLKRYPSNWELSSARASSVVRLFAAEGVPGKQLTAIGFGSSRPLFPNRDEAGKALPDNQARNRRIRVKVVARDQVEEKSLFVPQSEGSEGSSGEAPVESPAP